MLLLEIIITKSKKLQVDQGLSAAERHKILQLEEENKELRQHLENVEMIVASADMDVLTSGASTEDTKRLKDSIDQIQIQNRFKSH